MAEGKKSFVLYVDLIHTTDKLTDEQAGRLFKHILGYVNDLNPEPCDFITELAFEPVKQQLKRDLRRYEQKQTQRIEAGKRSAEQRKLNEMQRKSTTVDETQHPSTVNVDVDVNVDVNGNVDVDVLHKCNEGEKEEIPSHEIEFLIPTNLIESYMTSESQTLWFESYCMNNHITPEELKQKISDFAKDLRDKNIQDKNKKDLFIHFANWVNNGKRINRQGGSRNKDTSNFKGLATKRTITDAISGKSV